LVPPRVFGTRKATAALTVSATSSERFSYLTFGEIPLGEIRAKMPSIVKNGLGEIHTLEVEKQRGGNGEKLANLVNLVSRDEV
jgi:hypothetical protein